MSLRRFFTISFLVILAGSISVGAVYLYNFDLNSFRKEIETLASKQISRPLTLGKAHLSFKHGPAFAFNNVTVGTADDDLYLDVDRVYFRIQTLPLLSGKVLFSEILLEKPIFSIQLQQSESEVSPFRLMPEQKLLTKELIKSLHILNGTIRIKDSSRGKEQETFVIERFHFSIDDFNLLSAGNIKANATLFHRGVRSPFSIDGEYRSNKETASWDSAFYRVNLSIENLAAKNLRHLTDNLKSDLVLRGFVDLNMQIEGNPQTGVTFNTQLTGKSLDITKSNLKIPPIPISQGNLSGHIQYEKNAFDIKAKATLHPHGVLSPLSIDGEYRSNKETASWDSAFYRVNLSIENLAAKNLRHLTDNLKSDLALRGFVDLNMQIEGNPQTGVTFNTKLAGKNLDITKSNLKIPPIPISQGNLNGHIQYGKNALDLKITKLTLDTDYGRLEAENKARFTLSNDRLTGISSQGRLSIRLSSGTKQPVSPFFTRHLITSYQVDLDRTKHGWKTTKGQLTFPDLDVRFHGQWHDSDKQPHTLTFDIPGASLPAMTALMPGLNHLKLDGRFKAHLSLDIPPHGSLQTVGTLDLTDVHIATPEILADLNRLNGTIQLDNKSLFAKGLKADFGRSPVTVDLDIPDLTAPDVTLHVLGDAIRANELIFKSDSLYLKEIDGIFRLADNTLFLGPIHVKMDGGTDVTVNGTVKNFTAADIELDIKGEHGNIDEIIALWQNDHPIPPIKQPVALGSLKIDISADSGQISGMHFDQATSQIVRRNNSLVIGPIHFNVGSGKGLGQVLVVDQDEGPSLLKISGNLKNFDAQTVYQQILKRNGLVSGRLNADFYLEGKTGKQFLPTSLGTFTIENKDGQLYGLNWVSKILHILNIYPVLTENIRGKGLPFDTISFNAQLDKGILSTKDFLMEGNIMNLSMIGEHNLISNMLNFELGAMPLRGVDSILSYIPIAGWLLTGGQKALVVVHFKVTGDADEPDVKALPIESLTAPFIGILKRTFNFPVKIITDPKKAIINQ